VNDDFLTKQFIGGVWRDGSGDSKLEVEDPTTREVITVFRLASPVDLDEAYRSAAEAQKAWARNPPQVRRAIFEKCYRWLETHHDELVDYLVREGANSRLKAEFELGIVAELMRAAAALTSSPVGAILASPDPDKENRVYYEPVGVVGVLSPFNAPFFLSLRPLAPALALGNAVVLKPHELTPIMGGTMIARMFEDCGLPAGLLSVVVTNIAEIGDGFVEHQIPEVIVFTGSTSAGRRIAEVAGRNLKKAVLELGGNSALIVLDDADIELAVNAAIFSRFTHSGQICMSANRIVVDASLYEEFVEKYVAKAASLPVGSPRDPKNIVTPLISPEQADLLDQQVAEAVMHGATTALPAKPRDKGSALCTPVVLTDVTTDNPATKIEFFGPAVCILKALSEDDAIRIANDTPYGLSGAVHSADVERAVRVARRVRTGMIHVNNGTIADEAAVPFGGVGASGNGRLNGAATIETFTRPIWVSVHHGRPVFPY
jgi:acyl-CoA reductase-like NAD-dependent aldehyde dehydrogenase